MSNLRKPCNLMDFGARSRVETESRKSETKIESAKQQRRIRKTLVATLFPFFSQLRENGRFGKCALIIFSICIASFGLPHDGLGGRGRRSCDWSGQRQLVSLSVSALANSWRPLSAERGRSARGQGARGNGVGA